VTAGTFAPKAPLLFFLFQSDENDRFEMELGAIVVSSAGGAVEDDVTAVVAESSGLEGGKYKFAQIGPPTALLERSTWLERAEPFDN